jgi:hypothetical protein
MSADGSYDPFAVLLDDDAERLLMRFDDVDAPVAAYIDALRALVDLIGIRIEAARSMAESDARCAEESEP